MKAGWLLTVLSLVTRLLKAIARSWQEGGQMEARRREIEARNVERYLKVNGRFYV